MGLNGQRSQRGVDLKPAKVTQKADAAHGGLAVRRRDKFNLFGPDDRQAAGHPSPAGLSGDPENSCAMSSGDSRLLIPMEFRDEACGRAVVQILRRAGLHDTAVVHADDLVRQRQRLFLNRVSP